MKNRICLFVLFFITGCQDFVTNEVVTENYYLTAIDLAEDLALSYKLQNGDYIGVVKNTVFAVGYDESYIIVGQYPSKDSLTINYYIVPIAKKPTLSPEKGVFGPLSFEEYIEKRKELRISEDVVLVKIEELK